MVRIVANIIVNKINVVINPLQPRNFEKYVSNEICAQKSFEHQSFCNVKQQIQKRNRCQSKVRGPFCKNKTEKTFSPECSATPITVIRCLLNLLNSDSNKIPFVNRANAPLP